MEPKQDSGPIQPAPVPYIGTMSPEMTHTLMFLNGTCEAVITVNVPAHPNTHPPLTYEITVWDIDAHTGQMSCGVLLNGHDNSDEFGLRFLDAGQYPTELEELARKIVRDGLVARAAS